MSLSKLASILLLIVVETVVASGCNSGEQRRDASAAGDVGNVLDATLAVDAASPLDTGTLIDSARAVDGSAVVDASGSDTGPVTDGGGSLTVCGGRGGGVCATTEYCQYTGTPCGAADGTGVCRARPTACAPDPTVVCGCDGQTYASACAAASAGTDVSSTGACGGATTFACGPSLRCTATTQYCQITMGGAFPGRTTYACNTLTTCTTGAVPACATCFPRGGVGNMCVDVGPGEMTVTLLTP